MSLGLFLGASPASESASAPVCVCIIEICSWNLTPLMLGFEANGLLNRNLLADKVSWCLQTHSMPLVHYFALHKLYGKLLKSAQVSEVPRLRTRPTCIRWSNKFC